MCATFQILGTSRANTKCIPVTQACSPCSTTPAQQRRCTEQHGDYRCEGQKPHQQGSQVLFGEKVGLLLLWSKKLLRDVSRIAYEWRGQQVYKSRAMVPFSQLKKKKEFISIWFLAWEQVCLWIIHRRAGHTCIWRPNSLKVNETQSMKITQQILSSIT